MRRLGVFTALTGVFGFFTRGFAGVFFLVGVFGFTGVFFLAGVLGFGFGFVFVFGFPLEAAAKVEGCILNHRKTPDLPLGLFSYKCPSFPRLRIPSGHLLAGYGGPGRSEYFFR